MRRGGRRIDGNGIQMLVTASTRESSTTTRLQCGRGLYQRVAPPRLRPRDNICWAKWQRQRDQQSRLRKCSRPMTLSPRTAPTWAAGAGQTDKGAAQRILRNGLSSIKTSTPTQVDTTLVQPVPPHGLHARRPNRHDRDAPRGGRGPGGDRLYHGQGHDGTHFSGAAVTSGQEVTEARHLRRRAGGGLGAARGAVSSPQKPGHCRRRAW